MKNIYKKIIHKSAWYTTRQQIIYFCTIYIVIFTSTGMFVCQDGSAVINSASICDLSADCVDGSDEANCSMYFTLKVYFNNG